jgi:hypothetical protein
MVAGHELSGDEIAVTYNVNSEAGGAAAGKQYVANVDQADPEVIVLLDTVVSEEMMMIGVAREVASNVQKLRKEARLTPDDEINVFALVVKDDDDTQLGAVLEAHREKIADDLKSEVTLGAPTGTAIITKVVDIGKSGAQVSLTLVKKG